MKLNLNIFYILKETNKLSIIPNEASFWLLFFTLQLFMKPLFTFMGTETIILHTVVLSEQYSTKCGSFIFIF